MDSKLFTEWFKNHFVPNVKVFCRDNGVPYKVLLLLDNAPPSHPASSVLRSADGCVTTLFLPPNTTSLIQPMDQGILEACKKRYKRKLLWHVLSENESGDVTVPQILKQVNVKHVVYWTAESWEEASSSSLSKAWKKLLPDLGSKSGDGEAHPPSTEVASANYDEADLAGQFKEDEDMVTEWLASDAGDPGHQILTEDEIVAATLARNDPSVESSDSEDESAHVESTQVTPAVGCEACGHNFGEVGGASHGPSSSDACSEMVRFSCTFATGVYAPNAHH